MVSLWSITVESDIWEYSERCCALLLFYLLKRWCHSPLFLQVQKITSNIQFILEIVILNVVEVLPCIWNNNQHGTSVYFIFFSFETMVTEMCQLKASPISVFLSQNLFKTVCALSFVKPGISWVSIVLDFFFKKNLVQLFCYKCSLVICNDSSSTCSCVIYWLIDMI